MITERTIYKRTSAGKIQIWYMQRDGNAYRSISGQEDGKKVTANWSYCEGKNIGRSNETSPEEQCRLEVERFYRDRLENDYRENKENVDKPRFFKPMTASKYEDRKRFLEKDGCEHIYMQPKLDGIRCVVNRFGMWSRNGKPIVSSPHIFEALKPIFENHPYYTFDGELYNHDLRDNFNKLTSLINKKKPTPEDLAESKEKVQYHLYDIHDSEMPDDLFGLRYSTLKRMYGVIQYASEHMIKLTETVSLPNRDDTITDYATSWIEAGYEGAMIRTDNCPYIHKRSKQLLKWKEMQDEEFEIVDITEGEGNREGMASRIICKLPNGETFTAMPNGTFEYCTMLLENRDKYIGQMGTVLFQNYTPDGVPRFPKFKVVRDYE